jgi:UDP-N-acetylglucosamine enolpyruvyl transferase
VVYIERGYEDLVGKLRAVGADISIIDVPDEEMAMENIG